MPIDLHNLPDQRIVAALVDAALLIRDAAAALGVEAAALGAFLRSGSRGPSLRAAAEAELRGLMRQAAWRAAMDALASDDPKARLRALDLAASWLKVGEGDQADAGPPVVNITVHPPAPKP